MPLVKAQCTNCGGTLDVDASKEAAICTFCNSPYIVEKAIQQFNIHNTNYINNAYFCNEKESEEDLLKRGIKQLELKVWKDAGETFRQITKQYPENYKGWLGLCIVEANDEENHYEIESLRDNVMNQCPANLRDPLFGAKVWSQKRINTLMNSIQDCNGNILKNEEQVQTLKGELLNYKRLENQGGTFVKVGIGLIILGIVFVYAGKVFDTSSIVLLLGGMVLMLIGLVKVMDNKMTTSKTIEGLKNEIWEYKEKNEELMERIEDLRSKLSVEESNKKTQYFIDIIKY